jgi:hypothetical protein
LPDVDASCDWLRRSLYDAKIAAELIDQVEPILAQIKKLVMVKVPSWR